MICLIITVPSSFWFSANNNKRYGLWHECHTFNKTNIETSKPYTSLICTLNNKGKIYESIFNNKINEAYK